jgi:hypothetical protein
MAPDGSPRTGEITSGRGAAAGSIVTVWIDASGRLTRRHSPAPPLLIA